MIDIHHHIVYGVDDGPQTVEDSMSMLRLAARSGVRHIVATSHAMPSMLPFPSHQYNERLCHLQELCKRDMLPMFLHPGSEVLYSEVALRQLEQARLPTLAGSRYVLLEFGVLQSAQEIIAGLRRTANAGFYPILAHAERYRALLDSPSSLMTAREQFTLLLQMNASVFIRRITRKQRRFAETLIKNAMLDFIASDAHNTTSRPVNLLDGVKRLSQNLGSGAAMRIACGHAEKVLMHKAP